MTIVERYGEKIGGMATGRYDVLADGELFAEQLWNWLADEAALVDGAEPVMLLMARFMRCMAYYPNPMGGVRP